MIENESFDLANVLQDESKRARAAFAFAAGITLVLRVMHVDSEALGAFHE